MRVQGCLQLHRIGWHFMPFFNPVKPDLPRLGQALLQRNMCADGLVIITPEYNGGAPGVLKYFIDMLKFPESFERRPVAFVGLAAGVWGALRPVEQLQMIFGYRNALIFPERVFLPGIGQQLDADGRLKDPELVQRLRKQAQGFLQFVSAVHP